MDLAQLEAEQRLEIATFLGKGAFFANNPGLLQGALENVFHNNGSYAVPAEGDDLLDPETVTPKSQFTANVRTALNGGTLAADQMLLLEAISAGLYDPNNVFTIDGTIDENERRALTAFLADPDAPLTAIHGNISTAFNEHAAEVAAAAQAAALEAAAAAEAAAAEWGAAQGEMQVLAQLAALGHIDPSDIAGGFQPEHAQILQDIINSNNTFRMMPPAGVSAGTFVQDLYQRTFDGNGDLRIAGGLEITAHHMDGMDFSSIINAALDPNASPAQVQMAQGVLGVEIDADGEWTLTSLDAARTYLSAPQAHDYLRTGADNAGGVPDSLYSEQFGVAATGSIISALTDGSISMPSAADIDRIGTSYGIENLSSADLNDQIDAVATWLSDADNHEAYATMVATHALTEAEVSALAAATAIVEARVEAETAVEATINDGIDAVTPVLDLPAADVDMTAVDTALLNAETALRTGDLDGAAAELQTYLIEAEAAVLSAEMAFVRNHEGAFATAAHFLQGENPEVAAILTSGDPEAIREFLVSHDTTELQQIFYNSNTNLGASFGTNAMGSGWQRVIDARRDLADIRAEIEGTAPDTAPEVREEPAPAPAADPALVAEAVVPEPGDVAALVDEQRVMPDYLTAFDSPEATAFYVSLDPEIARDREAPAELRRLASLKGRIEARIEGLEDGTIPGNPASIKGGIVSLNAHFERRFGELTEENHTDINRYLEGDAVEVSPEGALMSRAPIGAESFDVAALHSTTRPGHGVTPAPRPDVTLDRSGGMQLGIA